MIQGKAAHCLDRWQFNNYYKRLLTCEASGPTVPIATRKKQPPFVMAIGNVEFARGVSHTLAQGTSKNEIRQIEEEDEKSIEYGVQWAGKKDVPTA